MKDIGVFIAYRCFFFPLCLWSGAQGKWVALLIFFVLPALCIDTQFGLAALSSLFFLSLFHLYIAEASAQAKPRVPTSFLLIQLCSISI